MHGGRTRPSAVASRLLLFVVLGGLGGGGFAAVEVREKRVSGPRSCFAGTSLAARNTSTFFVVFNEPTLTKALRDPKQPAS